MDMLFVLAYSVDTPICNWLHSGIRFLAYFSKVMVIATLLTHSPFANASNV